MEIPGFEICSTRGLAKSYLLILTPVLRMCDVKYLPLPSEASCSSGIPIVGVTCDFFVSADKQNSGRIANSLAGLETYPHRLFGKHFF